MRTTFSRSSRPGCTSGSSLEDVEPRAGDGRRSAKCGERRLVDDRASRRIDEKRRRLHPPERGGVDQVARLGAERAVERHDVGSRQQLVERKEARRELVSTSAGARRRPVICDLHPERPRPAVPSRGRSPSPTIPSVFPCIAGAEHEEHAPRPAGARPDEPLPLARGAASPSGEARTPGRRRLGQNARRVRHHARRARAHAGTSTLSYPTAAFATTRKPRAGGVQEGVVHPVVEQRHHAVGAGHGGVQLPRLERRGRGVRPRRLPPL